MMLFNLSKLNKKWLIIIGVIVLGLIVIAATILLWRDWQKKHPRAVEPFVANQNDENLTQAQSNFQMEVAIEPPTPETRVIGMPVIAALTKITGGAKIIGSSSALNDQTQSLNLVTPKNMGEINPNDLVYALNNAGLVLKGRADSTSTGAITISGTLPKDKDTLNWSLTFTTSSNSVIVHVGK